MPPHLAQNISLNSLYALALEASGPMPPIPPSFTVVDAVNQNVRYISLSCFSDIRVAQVRKIACANGVLLQLVRAKP